MKEIKVEENNIFINWRVEDHGNLKLMHFSSKPFCAEPAAPKSMPESFPFIGMNLSGYDRPYERHGNSYAVTAPGYRMKYLGHTDFRNGQGRRIEFHTLDEETQVHVFSYVQFYDGLSVIRIWHRIENRGKDMQTLEYISNFNYEGLEKEGKLSRDQKMRIMIPHNSWQRELNWKSHTFAELGLFQVQPDSLQRSSNLIRVSNTGNWSTKEYLPMGYVENTETQTGLFWQIEHNGSWHWEIGEHCGHLYLSLGGPNETYSHWFKELKPQDGFETVKAAVGVTAKGFEDAFGTLTQYRRRIRRKSEDNEKLPVIFNDYMNCLWAEPTAEKEFPLIDAAADAGCEYYCIDAGWYADGYWWDNVGEWEASSLRFSEGLKKVTDYIKARGMTPGLWLEPEVMGICCKKAARMPDDWFFVRHGKRVYDRSRFQLDYRNPKVRSYMTGVVDRLVKEYGAGYIKTDYNIEPGIGTEINADSAGDGLLQHERCYLAWLDGLYRKYPELVIENCSSGGLRMDYAMLSRCSIQSTSDQDDYVKYAVIAANAPTGAAPEQAAVWAYPRNHEQKLSEEELAEETVFNMVNAMLLRIHQSGPLASLDERRKHLVKEGIRIYKRIREDIRNMVPFWPLGLADYEDAWVSLGLKSDETAYLAVWKRMEGDRQIELPVKRWIHQGRQVKIDCIYPPESDTSYEYDAERNVIKIQTDKQRMGRLFQIQFLRR
ncbi:MAG: alpha-galactosidase [Dorea sp.]|nr:alpha-galactosidase [Dorea sp.]